MSDTIISFDHVSKEYRLGTIGGGSLKKDLQTWWAKKRGKEDPNARLGASQKHVSNEPFLALDDVSFEVKQGDALGIIGRNGAGKSTLLKLLSRVTAPTRGIISYSGRVASMLEVGTGFHGELTGRENVYLNGAILGMTRAEVTRKFDEIVAFAEMDQFIDTPVKRYSSGMYVKLAFAVAAHLDSEVLVMDEVLAVGDMKFQQKCLGRMGEATDREGRTVLYVSHNMNTIRQLCGRCVLLDKGVIRFNGKTEEAIQHYLNNGEKDQSSDLNFEFPEHPGYEMGNIWIQKLKLLNRNSNIYSPDEKIVFELKYQAKRDLQDVRFRMIVRYFNDVPVGLTFSVPFADLKKNMVNTSVFAFNPDNLAEGKYFGSIALYQTDSFGNSVVLDHISRAFTFEILDATRQKDHLEWDHHYWGSVNLNSTEVIS